MYIKKAKETDLDRIAALEAACFPAAEAADRDRLAGRLKTYPDCFWLGFTDYNDLICYAAGPVTAESDLTDEMYADPSFHKKNGDWLMIFSVCTLPEYRRQGYAAWLLNRGISEAGDRGCKGLVLTCKENMIEYYSRFGFENEGLSSSVHGGAKWYQMRLTFNEDYFYEHLFMVSDNPLENMKMLEETLWGHPM